MSPYKKLDVPEILHVIFHPREEIVNLQPPSQIEYIEVPVADGVSLGCWFSSQAEDAPTIILFHGNGETGSDYFEIANHFNQNGLNLFIASYRGYGKSGGVPTVTSMISDDDIVFNHVKQLVADRGYNGPLFVMGRSIGCVAAIELANYFQDKLHGLIIDSGFADTIPLLTQLGLSVTELDIDESSGFRNRDKISNVEIPTLILHGAKDSLISIPQAERLQAFCGARNKKFFVIPGADHNSLISQGGELYFETIKNFIDDVTGKTPTWRDIRKKMKAQKNDQ